MHDATSNKMGPGSIFARGVGRRVQSTWDLRAGECCWTESVLDPHPPQIRQRQKNDQLGADSPKRMIEPPNTSRYQLLHPCFSWLLWQHHGNSWRKDEESPSLVFISACAFFVLSRKKKGCEKWFVWNSYSVWLDFGLGHTWENPGSAAWVNLQVCVVPWRFEQFRQVSIVEFLRTLGSQS